MAELTKTQRIVLSAAAAREDGIAIVPTKVNKAAASKVGSCLVARKLMREARSKRAMPVWRQDEDRRPISLTITRAGRDAIAVERAATMKAPRSDAQEPPSQRSAENKTSPAGAAVPRAGSKQALMIGMLKARKGATLDALVEATGWLPHTTRAALTGLRRRGFAIGRSRAEGEGSVYRIIAGATAAAA
jgi:hypothetical protein